MLCIGLMSGTSMDGIDAALIDTDGAFAIKEIAATSLNYPSEFQILLKAAEFSARRAKGDFDLCALSYQKMLSYYLEKELALNGKALEEKEEQLLNFLSPTSRNSQAIFLKIVQLSTELHADLVLKLLQESGYLKEQIEVVGYHGQTLFHSPSLKRSLSLGDGQKLSNLLGIKVVNDFRRQDLEQGGCGAPFAPLYHRALALRDHCTPVVVVNCGGISNLTYIPGEDLEGLRALDTGPGNCLIDRLVRLRTQGKEQMDKDGHYGEKGQVNEEVLALLYEKSVIQNGQNYFSLLAPKALDSGDLVLLPELDHLNLEDACATLEAFTADSIIKSFELLKLPFPDLWILAGGGWYNPVISAELEKRLQQKNAEIKVVKAEAFGWNNKALEAQIFAYLALRSLQGEPLSVPGTTQVSCPQTGGQTFFPKQSEFYRVD